MFTLNCDLGESFGQWVIQHDAAIMPHLDMASIACGFHAGDSMVMQNTVSLAAKHGVSIGAHPGYPDLQGFGRRSMQMSADELTACIHYQTGALEAVAKVQGQSIQYIKPHGALYNDMMKDRSIFNIILKAVAAYPSKLPLVIQSTKDADEHRQLASAQHVHLIFEVFSDRLYLDDGSLAPRSMSGAVLSSAQMIAQVEQLLDDQTVTTSTGSKLALQADTLCLHGDTPEAIDAIEQIRQRVDKAKTSV